MEKNEVDEILGPQESEKPEGEGMDELEAVAQELIDAVHSKNAKDVAQALRAAFECLDGDDDYEPPKAE